MTNVGLEWNDRKCAAAHVKRGKLQINAESMNAEEEQAIDCLKQGSYYKFIGIMENTKQDDYLVLENLLVERSYRHYL